MLKAGFPDAAVIRTHQDVHDEHPPEAAPAPHHCGERFLRLNGVIFLLYLPVHTSHPPQLGSSKSSPKYDSNALRRHWLRSAYSSMA